MYILGISAFYHDSAAALLRDGDIICAAQEERFSRKKHDAGFPAEAIAYCLNEAGIRPEQVDYVAFYDKPFLKFERLIETYVAFAPKGFSSIRKSLPVWLRQKLFLKNLLAKELSAIGEGVDWTSRLLFSEHHLSHAASAFFPSPFEEAAVLTMDGVGEWATTSLATGKGNSLTLNKEILFPHSLGLLYSAFTYYAGFKVNSGEYKLMGLAPYGTPKYASLILDNIIDVKHDGSFHLDQSYFNYCTGLTMTSEKFHRLLGGKPRSATEPLEQRHMDMAASIQLVTQDIILKLARNIALTTQQKNLCLAGGVALNCVANGKLAESGIFERIWVQPAAGDAGGALGAALAVHHMHVGAKRAAGEDRMRGGYLGPAFSNEEIQAALNVSGANYKVLPEEEMIALTVNALASGHAVGWFQGRMEFGPRALGARSILANPKIPEMQSTLNLKIKYRESFRPFAPSVLKEDVSDWFEYTAESPYMLMVAPVARKRRVVPAVSDSEAKGMAKLSIVRSEIPAVTHVDYSARVQTVDAKTNPLYHKLLSEFKNQTGCPVIINTSFNVRGEPIVCTPADAFRCFMGTEMDMLVIGNCVLFKKDQSNALHLNYKEQFELD